jgi:DNA recombination protein RmuC
MLIPLALLALLTGAVAGFLIADRRRARELRLRSADLQRIGGELQRAAIDLQRALAERDLARDERLRSDEAAADVRRRLEGEQHARVTAETRMAEAERVLASHAEMRKQIEDSFAALAQKAFKDVSELLVHANKTQVTGALETKKVEIDALLKPLREMLDNYRGELHKSEETRNTVYGGLQEQIKTLMTAQVATEREASRLANALQSPVVRGSWGESSLKRCVELAGMSEFCDFAVQETFENDEGRRLRPDLVVRLPNNRVIAVDSKAPLNDYVAASDDADHERKQVLLVAHAKNVRRHIESLSRREYQSSVGESLDFTVMFLPGEHFLSAALVTDPTIFEFAVERKIYLASPTVLLPLLRAVAAGWKAERTEENAKKMHEAGVELFNRFVIVMEKIANVGKALEGTVSRYNEAVRSIDSRLWPKGEELQRMTGSGKDLGELKQLDLLPLESSKLRLRTQSDQDGEVVPFRESDQ